VVAFVFVVFALVSIPDGQRAIRAVFVYNTRANIQPCVFVSGHAFLSYSYNQNDRLAQLLGACIVPRLFFNSPGFAVSVPLRICAFGVRSKGKLQIGLTLLPWACRSSEPQRNRGPIAAANPSATGARIAARAPAKSVPYGLFATTCGAGLLTSSKNAKHVSTDRMVVNIVRQLRFFISLIFLSLMFWGSITARH